MNLVIYHVYRMLKRDPLVLKNFTGAKGKGGMADPSLDSGKRNVANSWSAGGDLGKGLKVNPFIEIVVAKPLL